MSIVLTETELSQIAALRTQANAGTIGYWQVYQALANMLQNNHGVSSSDATVLWLRGATEARTKLRPGTIKRSTGTLHESAQRHFDLQQTLDSLPGTLVGLAQR